MKKMKTNLDERNEKMLLKIECWGCWMAFWGLLAAIFIQMIIGRGEIQYILGEWIVFMARAFYLVISCMKNGIWDRHLKPNRKTNMISSLLAGAVTGVLYFLIYTNRGAKTDDCLWFALFMAVITFGLCFAALEISAIVYKKRSDRIENQEEPEDEN